MRARTFSARTWATPTGTSSRRTPTVRSMTDRPAAAAGTTGVSSAVSAARAEETRSMAAAMGAKLYKGGPFVRNVCGRDVGPLAPTPRGAGSPLRCPRERTLSDKSVRAGTLRKEDPTGNGSTAAPARAHLRTGVPAGPGRGQRAVAGTAPGALGRGLPAAAGSHNVMTCRRSDLRRIARAVSAAASPAGKGAGPRARYRARQNAAATATRVRVPGANAAARSKGRTPKVRNSMTRN